MFVKQWAKPRLVHVVVAVVGGKFVLPGCFCVQGRDQKGDNVKAHAFVDMMVAVYGKRVPSPPFPPPPLSPSVLFEEDN